MYKMVFYKKRKLSVHLFLLCVILRLTVVFLLFSLSGFHLELSHWFYQASYEMLQFYK